LWKRIGEILVHDGVLSIASINVQTGEPCLGTQVFSTVTTELAPPTAGVEPAHSQPISLAIAGDVRPHGIDHAHDLMPRDERQSG
jgi:hypothetical protein